MRSALACAILLAGCAADIVPDAPSTELTAPQPQTDSPFGAFGYGIHGIGSFHVPPSPEHDVDPMPGLWLEHFATPNRLAGAAKVGPYAVGALVTATLVPARDDEPPSRAHLPVAMFAHATITTFDDGVSSSDLRSPLHPGFPWGLLERHRALATRATIWLDPARAWVDARIEIDLEHRADAVILESAIGLGLDVVDARWRGRPVAWRTLDSWLVVEPSFAGRGLLELHLRGMPRRERDRLDDDRARLHALVPVISGRSTSFDVTLHVPAPYHVDAALPTTDAPSAAGWRAVRVHGVDTHLVAVVRTDDRHDARVAELGGVRWELERWLPVEDLTTIADALVSLGPAPAPAARLVGAPADVAYVPRAHRDDLILVPLVDEQDPMADARHRAASAIAAWWLATALDSTHEICSWRDAAALHVGTWPLSPAETKRVRRGWAETAGAASPFRLRSNGPQLEEVRAELCARGALVLAELERRIGRDRLAAVLRAMRATPRRHAGWSALADEVARRSPDDAIDAWFRGWIDRPRSPALGLCDVTRDGATVRGTLVPQLGHPRHEALQDRTRRYYAEPYRGAIAVAAMAGHEEIARVVVDVTESPVTFTIPEAAGATSVVVDPDATLPMRLDRIPSTSAIAAPGQAAAPACDPRSARSHGSASG